jgi:hypothetical protein
MAEMNVDLALAKKIATDVESGKLTLPPSLRAMAAEYRTGLTACSAHVDDLAKPLLEKGSADPQVQEFVSSGKKGCALSSDAILMTSLYAGINNRLAQGDKDVIGLVQKYASQSKTPQNQ